jgi:thiol-disulfide isomerase/thioredoxin
MLAALLVTGVNVQAQYENLAYAPEKIMAGATFSFQYNAAGTPVENQQDVSCVLNYFSNVAFRWIGVDVKLTAAGKNRYSGEFSTPKDASFFTMKFIAGDSVDNNHNRTYGMLLSDSTHPGLNAPASRAAWGLLRSPGYAYSIEGYIAPEYAIKDTVTHYWLDMELKQPNAVGRPMLAVPYALSLYRAYGMSEPEKFDAVIRYLTRKESTPEDWLRAWYIAANIIKQQDKADTLALKIRQAAAVNGLTKLEDYRAFMSERNMLESTKKAQQFLEKYPYKDRQQWFDDLNFIQYDRMFLAAVLGKIEKNDFSSIDTYLDQLPMYATVTIYYKTIEIAHKRKTIDDAYLYDYSLKLIKHMEQLLTNQPEEFSYYSPMEWKKKVEDALFSGLGRTMYVTHTEICNNTARYTEALQYATIVEKAKDYSMEEVNNEYVKALQHTGNQKDVKQVLLKSIYKNEASVEMLDLLKKDYQKEHGSMEGYSQYLQSLKNAANAHHVDLQKDMINKPMPVFSMKDANGKTVSLQSLKGKVVILDFWAQWCVPCKASFPGMNLAVEQYKNDPEVVFYFVDTEEGIKSNYKEVNKKYLKDHNFSFNLLFDNPQKDGKNTGEVFERVCKAFTISGIPQKIILDKQGNVRFITVGFNGSASQLADEMTELIEITKKL